MDEQHKSMFDNMVAVANAHKASAELLHGISQYINQYAEKKELKGPGGRILNFSHVVITRIIIYGLNIEILLKAICLADNGVRPNGHDWVTLFNLIPHSRQQEIIDNLDPIYKLDFNTYLSKNKDIFIKWRYTYEQSNLECDISFVQNFANVLGSIALKIH